MPKVIPLRWQPHHVHGNGWYGRTPTGALIVYVYQPVDMRLKTRNGRSYWCIYQYWLQRDGRVQNDRTGQPAQFPTPRKAKLAAQRYWRREVMALLADR